MKNGGKVVKLSSFSQLCDLNDNRLLSPIGAKPGGLDSIKAGGLVAGFETLTLYAHYVWYCRENGLMPRSSRPTHIIQNMATRYLKTMHNPSPTDFDHTRF